MTTTSDSPAATSDSLAATSADPVLAPSAAIDAPASPRTHAPDPASQRLLVIEAGREESQYWADLWRMRELLGFMVWRDILVRYKQTAIGVAWSVVRPLLAMVAGTFVFEYLLGLKGVGTAPYAVMIYIAMLPWQFFSDGLSGVSGSLVANSAIISKIYFPRLMIPTSKMLVSLVDFLISSAVLALILLWYRLVPSWQIVFIPVFLLFAALCVLSLGLWFAALMVKYRDFAYIVPFILQFGIYIVPVFYSTSKVTESHVRPVLKFLYFSNPLVTLIEGFRWCILGPSPDIHIHWAAAGVSVAIVLVLLATGHWYFRATEQTFADVI